MGFFNKMFGDKTSEGETSVDFITALSMHLRGEVDSALSVYQAIDGERPDENLAPFFAAAIMAGQGDIAQAAESLRFLSRRIASGGGVISGTITLELVALLNAEPFLRAPGIAEIIVAFGDLLKKEQFLQESVVCYGIAAGLVPDNAHVLHKLGDTLHDLRSYATAEKVLLDALKYAPNHWGALYTYAVLLQDLGRIPEAITYYERATALIPDHAKSQNNYGAALMLTHRLDEALDHCTLAAKLDPSLHQSRLNLGNIYLLKQEYETARQCFVEALSMDATLASAYYGLGLAEDFLGNDSGRIGELYLKAIELNPALPEFHHAMGNLLAREGNPEAVTHFSAAAQLNNNLINLHRDFGAACLKLGRHEEALDHLRIALQQNPKDDLAQGLLAQAEAEVSV